MTREQVLIVDANPFARSAMRRKLEFMRFGVRSVSTAYDAITAIHETDFAFVTLAIAIPGDLNSVELARAMQRQVPKLCVFLIAGHDDPIAKGVEDFVILLSPGAARIPNRRRGTNV